MQIKIGIDLAKWKTGIAIMDGNFLFYADEVNVFGVEDARQCKRIAFMNNCRVFCEEVNDIIFRYLKDKKYNEIDFIIGIEVANFGNGGQTAEYNFFAGYISSKLCETLFDSCSKRNIEQIGLQVKCFNHDEWYQYIGNCILNGKKPDNREESKKKSVATAKYNNETYMTTNNDNIADAINIAWYLEHCLDSYDREYYTWLKKQVKSAKKQSKIDRLNKEIKKYETI